MTASKTVTRSNLKLLVPLKYSRRGADCLASDHQAVGAHAGLSVDLIEAGAQLLC